MLPKGAHVPTAAELILAMTLRYLRTERLLEPERNPRTGEYFDPYYSLRVSDREGSRLLKVDLTHSIRNPHCIHIYSDDGNAYEYTGLAAAR